MRTLTALLPLSLAVLLGACANPMGAQAPASCEVANVPAGAVFGTRQGLDIATWPPEMAPGATACQRVWYGKRQQPDAMQVLATYYFDKGDVRRLVGKVPGGAAYDCHYRNGALDTARSQNPGQCPQASEIRPGR